MEGRSRRTPKQNTGDSGESLALSFLLKKGYQPVTRNYHSRYGEIDLIVRNDEFIVFVEVKTRGIRSADDPAAFVDRRKQQRVIKTAFVYLEENASDLQPRFDVIGISLDPSGSFRLEHIENAFSPDDNY